MKRFQSRAGAALAGGAFIRSRSCRVEQRKARWRSIASARSCPRG